MEFNYSNFDGDVRWWKIGIGDVHRDNPIIFWKPLLKHPSACHQRLAAKKSGGNHPQNLMQ